MALSEKTKSRLLSAIAISPIMRRFALPGLVGLLLIAAGVWRDLVWLTVTGIILAAPVIWAYAVLIFVYIPCLIFDGLRRGINRSKSP